MNTVIFVNSLEYISKNYTLLVTLSGWIYEELSEHLRADHKLLRSIKKQDYEVTSSIIKYIIRLNMLVEQAIYSFSFVGDPCFRIKLLIDYGASQDIDIFGNFLLSKAAELGYIDAVRLLLSFGIDANIIDADFIWHEYGDDTIYAEAARLVTDSHINALTHACKNNQHEIVDLLLHEANIGTYAKSESLYYMDTEDIPMIKMLLENGADVNHESAESVWCACEDGHNDITKLFIDSGFDLELYGSNIFKLCIMINNLEIAEYLLERGVVPRIINLNRQYFSEAMIELILSFIPDLFDNN